jgi:NAD(P)H-dependent FMN reductase
MSSATIVGLCGSLRDQSTTRTALEHALDAAAEAGADTTLIDLRDREIPIYDGDEPAAGEATEIRETIESAEGVLLATPVYHASMSSPLKTALDYCRRSDFEDTTVGLLCTAGGRFYGPVFSHLRAVVQILDAWVLPHQVAIPDAGSVISGDVISDDEIAARLAKLGEEVTAYARIDKCPEMREEPAILADD